jgi:hypothetical protein
MDMTRRGALGALAAYLACAHVSAAALRPLTLAEVIRLHTGARGGAAALDSVHRMAIDLDITEHGSTVRGRYLADTQGLVRIDVYAGGHLVYREGVDRAGVWLWPGNEAAPRPSIAVGAANALLHGAEQHLFGLHRFAARGHRLRLLAPQQIDGTTYQVIECVFTTGHVSAFYLDPSSWLIVRERDERAYHPDYDPTRATIETRLSEFTVTQGVVAPNFKADYDLARNALLSSSRVTRRMLNPTIAAGVFDRAYQAPATLA